MYVGFSYLRVICSQGHLILIPKLFDECHGRMSLLGIHWFTVELGWMPDGLSSFTITPLFFDFAFPSVLILIIQRIIY